MKICFTDSSKNSPSFEGKITFSHEELFPNFPFFSTENSSVSFFCKFSSFQTRFS